MRLRLDTSVPIAVGGATRCSALAAAAASVLPHPATSLRSRLVKRAAGYALRAISAAAIRVTDVEERFSVRRLVLPPRRHRHIAPPATAAAAVPVV